MDYVSQMLRSIMKVQQQGQQQQRIFMQQQKEAIQELQPQQASGSLSPAAQIPRLKRSPPPIDIHPMDMDEM